MRLYVTVGTNDFARAVGFYDAVFTALGVPPLPGRTAVRAGWSEDDSDGTGFWLVRPFDGQPATHGNGSMIGFPVANAAAVRRAHAAGLAHGGTDEGAPGTRPYYSPDFYVAYLRDPDGNKLSFFHFIEEPEP